MMTWQDNWPTTAQHFRDWWDHRGLVVTCRTFQRAVPREACADPGAVPPGMNRYTAPRWWAQRTHHQLANWDYLGDSLALANIDIGPGSLALALGSEPEFAPSTVWFKPIYQGDPEPERQPPLRFNPASRWWQLHEESARLGMALAGDKYAVGCPDLIENLDIISALRDPQQTMLDLIERPAWIEQKIWEINDAWFAAYQRLYDLIKLPDGSSCWGAFSLWGPGKTAKVQCDASAMFSPAMFRRLVVPALTVQCDWLDHSMFHVDGHQCLCQVDDLLAIEALAALEWTPDPTIPKGGDPCWYPLYRRILAAGKSVQAIHVSPHEVIPLLDAVGPRGMYIMVSGGERDELERLMARIESYRG
jgi:hypothetical protein